MVVRGPLRLFAVSGCSGWPQFFLVRSPGDDIRLAKSPTSAAGFVRERRLARQGRAPVAKQKKPAAERTEANRQRRNPKKPHQYRYM